MISVFGSCVSRDVFEFDANLSLGTYLARQSLISAVSPPVSIDIHQIELDSDFQRRQVCHDIAKTAFKELSEFGDGWLLLDFFEERHPLAMYKDTIVTRSPEFCKSGLSADDAVPYEIGKGVNSVVAGYPIDFWLDRFFQKIIAIFPSHRIILNRVYLTDYYKDENRAVLMFDQDVCAYNKRINRKLDYLYNAVKAYFVNCTTIDLRAEGYTASATHRWGLASTHYEDAFYKDLAQRLRMVTEQNANG